jgi:hypothetical protein
MRSEKPVLEERWSFGGAVTAVTSGAGAFLPGGLLADAQKAVADGWWRPPSDQPHGVFVPRLEDVTAVDDRGVTYALRSAGLSTSSDHPDRETWPQALRVRLDPVPAQETGWIEFRGRDGTTARLLPSARMAARVGPSVPVEADPAERELLRHARTLLLWSQSSLDAETLGPLVRRSRSEILGQAASLRRSGELDPASEVPGQIAAFCDALLQQRVSDGLQVGWATMLAGAGRRDGPVWSLDLAVALLSIEEVTLRLDALVSAADCWRLYLRAAPGWYRYGEPDEDGGRSVREVSVIAEDDHGGAYISELGGDRHLRRRARERLDHEEQVLRFRPRLVPLAGALHLTFRGAAEEILVSLDLGLRPAPIGARAATANG